MDRRTLLQTLAVAPALAGCSPFIKPRTIRFRLDMLARVEGVERRAHTVFEVRWTKNLIVLPETGEWGWHRTGDALMLDLGAKGCVFGIWEQAGGVYRNSFRGATRQLFQLLPPYKNAISDDYKDGTLFDELMASKKTVSLLKQDWPQLIYFSDVRDLQAARAMPIDHVEEMLGPDSKVEDFTLHVTQEPVSRGIQKRLPWWGQWTGNPLHLNPSNFVIDG